MQAPSTRRASSIHGVSSRSNGRLREADTFSCFDSGISHEVYLRCISQQAAITIVATNAIDAFAAPTQGRLHSPARMACAFRHWREWRLRRCAFRHVKRFHQSHSIVTRSGLSGIPRKAVTVKMPYVSRRLHWIITGRVDLADGWQAQFWQAIFLEQTSNEFDTARWKEECDTSSSIMQQPHWQHLVCKLVPDFGTVSDDWLHGNL